MLWIMGLILAFTGTLIYGCTVLHSGRNLIMGKRLIFAMLGVPVSVYYLVFLFILIAREVPWSDASQALIFGGLAFLFINLGRSMVAPRPLTILSEEPKAFSLSIIHIVIFEVMAIYTLEIFELGVISISEGLSISGFNTSVMFVSIGTVASSILMGTLMRRVYEDIHTYEDMRKLNKKVIISAVAGHVFSLAGMIIAFTTMIPYLS